MLVGRVRSLEQQSEFLADEQASSSRRLHVLLLTAGKYEATSY
jgi:hypothetical protein